MKFLLESAGTYYSTKKAKKLKALGFQFDKKKAYVDTDILECEEHDTDGTAWVKKDKKVSIEFDTLKDLCKFAENMKELIILTHPRNKEGSFSLTIYDHGYID